MGLADWLGMEERKRQENDSEVSHKVLLFILESTFYLESLFLQDFLVWDHVCLFSKLLETFPSVQWVYANFIQYFIRLS